MKKIILCICILVLLTGCSNKTQDNPPEHTTSKAIITESTNSTPSDSEESSISTTEEATTAEPTTTEEEIIETKITKQPQNTKITEGESVTFSVTAEGTNLKFQWLESRDEGMTWNACNKNGYNSNTLKFNADKSYDKYKYRCQINGDFGEELSNAATLTVSRKIIEYDIGDIVYFGRYEQDGNYNNGFEPISWYVIEKEAGKYLLLSQYCLDNRSFNGDIDKDADDEFEFYEWEGSAIRKWLNNEFLDNAFSAEEKQKIKEYNHDNIKDTVFLLDIYTAFYLPEEIMKGPASDYSLGNGTRTAYYDNPDWMTRTKMEKDNRCYGILEIQYAEQDQDKIVGASQGFVRPAIYVDISFEDIDIVDNDKDNNDSSNILGGDYKQAATNGGIFVESDGIYYPLSVGKSFGDGYNYFLPEDGYIQKANAGERIIIMEGLGYYSINKVNNKNVYSFPQKIIQYTSNKSIQFDKPLDDSIKGVPETTITDIDGISSEDIMDFYYLSENNNYLTSSDIKELKIHYYKNYEEKTYPLTLNYRYYALDEEKVRESSDAPEGFKVIDTSGLSSGFYIIKNNTLGYGIYYYIFEIVE